MVDKFDVSSPEIQERIIVEGHLIFAFLNKMPIVPGHTLICPKRVVASSRDLTFEEWKELISIRDVVCGKLQKALSATGFNFAWNEGVVAGQTVPHFHLHVVPRKEQDAGIVDYEPRVFLYRPGSRADSPKEELSAFAHALRKGDVRS